MWQPPTLHQNTVICKSFQTWRDRLPASDQAAVFSFIKPTMCSHCECKYMLRTPVSPLLMLWRGNVTQSSDIAIKSTVISQYIEHFTYVHLEFLRWVSGSGSKHFSPDHFILKSTTWVQATKKQRNKKTCKAEKVCRPCFGITAKRVYRDVDGEFTSLRLNSQIKTHTLRAMHLTSKC